VTGLPTPTGLGLKVGFGALHAGSASGEVGFGIVRADVLGPSSATKASDGPERLDPPARGDTVGKDPEVSPLTNVFKDESSTMLVPMSVPDPPK
jgi:hypothetical protein